LDGDGLPPRLRVDDPSGALAALKAAIDAGVLHVVEVNGALVACVPIVDASDALLLLDAVDALGGAARPPELVELTPRRPRVHDRVPRGHR
jgi:hypothetical protein